MSTTVGLVSVAHRGRDGEDGIADTASRPTPSDDGLARRLKALACTAPLHDLDARKGRLEWADASAYQMAEIAFLAIDQVTIAMDFDRGAGQAEIADRLVPMIAVQVPGRDPAEYARVTNWVIDNLINTGSLNRGFQAIYGVIGAEGDYRRLRFDFKLLEEHVSPEGDIFLRASDEAINVLVGALDTDVESAQVAAEVKLDNLIRRGRLSDAQLAAEQARYRTVQYAEILRRKLDATRRDVRSVDWLDEVPTLVQDALKHVDTRYKAENAILANIAKARDEADQADRKLRAAQLVEIVRDCIRRHTQLQARLQEAGEVFRSEQDRQQFSGPPQRAAVDLFGQLLVPVLDQPIGDVANVAEAFFRGIAGTTVPLAPRLSSVIDMLLTLSRERDTLGESLPEPDLAPLPDPERFDSEVWEHAERLLELSQVPRRLSALIGEARSIHPDLPHLVVLLALHAVSPPVATSVRHGEQAVIVAVDDGTPLRDPQFGGADLLVAVAGIRPAEVADQHKERSVVG